MKTNHTKQKKSVHNRNILEKKISLAQQFVEGIIQINQFGKGFVANTLFTQDIEVLTRDLNTALNGDIVRVSIIGNPKQKRPRGVVEKVIKRKQSIFLGRIIFQRKKIVFFPDTQFASVPMFDVERNSIPKNINNNQLIVVQLKSWNIHERPIAKFISTCEAWSQTQIVYRKILMGQGFATEFPKEVIQEATHIHEKHIFKSFKKRKDFRDIHTFTIDPNDAKDFDDAISFKSINENLFEIGIHIADVSHFVKEGSALDHHAKQSATSVYLPGEVMPMLPEILSNDLCSLVPFEDRFCFAAIFEMTMQGVVKKVSFHKTCIQSNRRFTYNDVQQIIDNQEGDYKDTILLLNRIAQQLRKERLQNGAINFSSQDVHILLNENLIPQDVVTKEYTEAHQLVEELMLLANKHVAIFVSEQIKKGLAFPFRVHDLPDEEKLNNFIQFAKKKGYAIVKNTPKELADSFNQMLVQIKDKPEQLVLETLGIRSMAKAQYSVKNIGHFGLGFPFYCHFTSPIRRYPDIMVHRVLYSILEKKYSPDTLIKKQCLHCSDRERAAMECERTATKYKLIELVEHKIGEVFEAVISGINGNGFWAESIRYRVEGFISRETFDKDNNFVFIEKDFMLYNKKSHQKLQMGDTLKVQLISASTETLKVNYLWKK